MEVEEIIPNEINPDDIIPIEKMNQFLENNKLP